MQHNNTVAKKPISSRGNMMSECVPKEPVATNVTIQSDQSMFCYIRPSYDCGKKEATHLEFMSLANPPNPQILQLVQLSTPFPKIMFGFVERTRAHYTL